MRKILTVVGARPQFIKAAAISRTIEDGFSDSLLELIVHTGQHYDHGMSEVFFKEMGIPHPAYNLSIGSGSHGAQTGTMLSGIEELIIKEKADAVLVYGDTNSTLAGSLAAAKLHIPVIHIEAGLRSFNKTMPEEINRIMTDHVSTLLFSPTSTGIENLKKEGLKVNTPGPYSMDNPGIFQVGDIMYDSSLFYSKKYNTESAIFSEYNIDKDNYILTTIHRPSNTDDHLRLKDILNSLLKITKELNTNIVFPVHPRTKASFLNFPDKELIAKIRPENGIHIIPAASFLEMIQLESNSRLILTDSGGVQKEAWFMKKPVVILRSESEWVEIIEHGNGVLANASPDLIFNSVQSFLNNPPTNFPEIYGSGNAASEILNIVASSEWR